MKTHTWLVRASQVYVSHIGAMLFIVPLASLGAWQAAEAETPTSITIRSEKPANGWQDALIGGNGRQGVMVHGFPLEEKIVLNHEKFWVPAQPVEPDVPNIAEAMQRARELAKQEKWSPAASTVFNSFNAGNKAMFPEEALIRPGPRLGLNYVHPGLYLRLAIPPAGEVTNYRRTLELDTGEITVGWTDDRGDWKRTVFVSRPDHLIVTRVEPPTGTTASMKVRFAERVGWDPADIEAPKIEHTLQPDSAPSQQGQMYLHTAYKHKHGLPEAEGYHAMSRVIVRGGQCKAMEDHLAVTDAEELLILTRLEFLPVASQANRQATWDHLASVQDSYDQLLDRHARVHGEMFRRVSFNLGGNHGGGRSTETIIAEAEANGPTPAYLELIYAVGRYTLISSSGELPPTLMGIWGDTWKPMWWGHYTSDSNLNLAISGGSVGNLPEAMESYFSWIETLYPDWERNASQLYGVEGYMGAIAHGWRHGRAIVGWQGWTGAAGWLGVYFWQHYLFTGDEVFLAERVVPLLENTALFYQGFLEGMENEEGRYLIYPSISPENSSPNTPGAPNATSEIAIIRETFASLIEAYRVLGTNEEKIPELQAVLEKLPEYRINEDGTIAEWSYPGVADNYNHRHNSHLHAVYPGIDITPATPKLYEAAKVAIQKRLEAGQGNKSAHGFMELGFFGSRLQEPSIVWDMLTDYAKSRFIYRSFISSHNPDHRIYNLDSILALPAIMAEMCLVSRPGQLDLLPGIPADALPRGEIRGILARTAITINKLSWDIPQKQIVLELTSRTDQDVVLTSRLPLLRAESDYQRSTDEICLQLPAGKKVKATITLE